MRKTLLFLALLCSFSRVALLAQDGEARPLITDVSQLSSPFSDYQEGTDIGALIDNNTSTFWHSDWHNQTTGDVHWVDVALKEPVKGIVYLYMHRRNASNDHPTKVVISGSTNGTTWNEIFTADLPYQGFSAVMSEPFAISEPVSHIRLTVTDCTGSSIGFRKIWHAAEIQLYQVSEKFEFNTDISKFKINEVQVANIDQFIDHSYNYGAWIELYNADDVQHSLDKAILRHTDNDGVIDEYAFGLSHGMLASKGFATLWFDHHNTQGTFGGKAHLQIPFKLDPDGGTIELLDTKGEVIDAVDYPPAIARCAYARTEDGAGEWGWTAQATPKKSNAGVTFSEERLPAPEVNTESTLFTRSITFKVNIPAGATLRYTKDGSTPTATNGATSRAGAFTTQETTVYRFVLIADGMLPSPVVTRTFIKDENDLEIPVLCISTHPDNLYSDTLGVYTKGTNGVSGNGQNDACNWNMDWERPVNVEYMIKEEGTYRPVINQEAEFKIAGGWSRAYGGGNGWMMKSSFRLKTGKVYEGLNSFDYPIFNSKPYNKYKTLQVRNGGNDTYARIYDAAIHEIFRTSGFYIDCQAWQPCHVFFNGEYLGMFNIRENNNKHYGESGYGIDTDEMDQFELNGSVGYEQKSGTRDAFWQWLTLTKQLAEEPTNEKIWQQICEMVDIDEFCNYMAAECYIGSNDWLTNSNNIKGFRSQTDGGKFHLVMFDTDSGFGNNNMISSAYNLLNNNDGRYADNGGKSYLAEIFFNMLKYEPFKRQFIHAFSIVGGSVMEPERCKRIIDEMVAYTKDALALEGNDPTGSANSLYSRISNTGERAARMNNMKSFMGLTQEYKVTLESNIPEARLLIDGQEVPTRKFDGTLFGPVSIATKAPAGYVFQGWQLLSNAIGEQDVIPLKSSWQYYDKGSLDDTNWRSLDFSTSGWGTGKAPYGYGTVGTTENAADYNTELNYGGDASNKRPTYYFRKKFTMTQEPSSEDRFYLHYHVDDGVIFYINGTEVGTYHCLSGSKYSDFSTAYEGNKAAQGTIEIPASVLCQGTNIIAAEVHNTSFTSSDIFFEARLTRNTYKSVFISDQETFNFDESSVNGTYHIVAQYKPITDSKQLFECGASPVRINEVSADNSIYINDHYKKNDWVELYNTTDRAIDISGMYLSDTRSNPQKYQISANGSLASTIIPPYGRLVVWCDKLTPISQLHAPFKLDNADGACVTLQSEDGIWYDEMEYAEQDRWQTYGRYPDGGQHSSYLDRPTITHPNAMMSHDFMAENTEQWNEALMAITLSLEKGWNWTSHNLATSVHRSRFTGYAQYIMGKTESYVKDDASSWSGTFNAMLPATGYKVKMESRADISLRGELYDTATPVTLVQGWNWIGCPLYNATTIEAALKEYVPTEGDAIIGINGFTTYENGQWEGTLTSLSPGQTYLLKCNEAQTFRWNSLSASTRRERRYSAPEKSVAAYSSWQTDMHAYPHAIGVVATLQSDETMSNYTLAAFHDDECRGIAEEVNGLLYLNIYGEGDEDLCFKLMNHQGKVYDIVQTLTFTPESIVGSRKSPLKLTLKAADIDTPLSTASRIISTTYYTLNGMRISTPTSGVFIQKVVYEDGHTMVQKVIL